jgi:hypothetical protein
MDEDDGFSTTPPARDNPALSLARANVALLASVVAALMFAIRLVAVTGGDLYTASILLAETSVGDAIRVLLFSVVVPVTLLIVAVYAGFFAGLRGFDLGTIVLLTVSAIAYSTFNRLYDPFNISNTPRGFVLNFYFYIALLLPTAFLFYTGHWVRSRNERPLRLPLSTLTIYAFVGLLAYLVPSLIAKDFWLPRERLDFKNEAPFTGYVLKVSQDHLIIMNDNPRVIVEKHKDTLEDRDFCYTEDHKARSSNVKSDAPVCP